MALNLPHERLHKAAASPVRNISFNSSRSLFTVARTDGWTVHSTVADFLSGGTRKVGGHEFPNSSFKFILPLLSTNVLLLVGGPPNPKYTPNKVVFWDDESRKAVAELEFAEDVKGLVSRGDRIAVALRNKVVLFAVGKGGRGIWREGSWETWDNPRGLVAIASSTGSTTLAIPGSVKGQVKIIALAPYDPFLPPSPPSSTSATPPPLPKTLHIIPASKHSLAALTLTPSGTRLATTGSKGTIIRVFQVDDRKGIRQVAELTRGSDGAEVWDLQLRRDGNAVAVTSDKGTVHVWTRIDQSVKGQGAEKVKKAQTAAGVLGNAVKSLTSTGIRSNARFWLAPPANHDRTSLVVDAALNRQAPLDDGAPMDDVALVTWVEMERVRSGKEQLDRRKEKGKEREAAQPPAAAVGGTRPKGRISAEATVGRSPNLGGSSGARGSPTGLGSLPMGSRSSSNNTALSQATTAGRGVGVSSTGPGGVTSISTLESQLVVITYSGAWYRLSFDLTGKEKDRGGARSRSEEELWRLSEGGLGGGGASDDEDEEKRKIKEGRDNNTTGCAIVEQRKFWDEDGWD